MKKTTLIAAALASLLLAACGAVDSSTDGTTTTTAAPAASQEQTPESETSSESGSQPEDEPASQEDSEPGESTASVPDKTEPNMTEHEWLLSNIEDGSFTSTDGETVTFTQLVEQGKANAYKEGCAFALVSAGGGAGHTYYDCYTTADGGKNWEKGSQPVDLFSGVSYSFALEDGRLMFLTKRGSFDDPAPILTTVYIEGGAVFTENNEGWINGVKLDDGTAYDGTVPVDFSARYLGEYRLELSMANADDGSVLLQRELALDPETLAVTEPEEPEETKE